MKKKIYKIACIIFLIIGILLLLDGMTGRIDNNKLYDKKNITVEDVCEAAPPSALKNSRSTWQNGAEAHFVMLSGLEYIGSKEISDDESIDVELTKGKAKIAILYEESDVVFCEEVSTLSFEPSVAGEYDVFIIGKWYTGKVTLE